MSTNSEEKLALLQALADRWLAIESDGLGSEDVYWLKKVAAPAVLRILQDVERERVLPDGYVSRPFGNGGEWIGPA